MMRKVLISATIFLVLLLAPIGIRYLQYNQLTGSAREAPPVYNPTEIQAVPTPVAGTFVDEPQLGSGAVLLDMAHDNQFALEEIQYLNGRLAARGFELRPHTGSDLAAALRSVTAYVVISPIREHSRSEIQAVSDFVDRGGRLLLVGDPTNFMVTVEEDFFGFDFRIDTDDIPLNTLANRFNIIFEGDYLYNTIENEGNFRNILLKSEGFADHVLLDGVDRLAFYGSHSLQLGAGSQALITADDNTWSSATDRAGDLVVAATSREARVLALGDYHFLRQPYYTVYDNGRFIAAMADFLTRLDDRSFILGDFPYFYQQPVNLVYLGQPDLGPSAFGEIIGLQSAFRQVGQSLNLAAAPKEGHDILYLGLYNQAQELADVLAEHEITLIIDPPIDPDDEANDNGDEEENDDGDEEENDTAVRRLIQSDLGPIQMAGTALILLHENGNSRQVIVLAASSEGLQTTLDRLLDVIPLTANYALADCLLQDNLALCPTLIADEAVEAELETGGVPVSVTRPDSGTAAGDYLPDLDAVQQGSINLGQTVEGTLDVDESHAWIFSDGPAVIDILVEADPELDAILELYGPDNELIERVDRAFTGGDELLSGVEIPDDGRYTIVVRDFFDEGGGYTLTVSEGELVEGRGIFIFVDERGTPLSGGFTSATTIAGLLSDRYEVTIWSLAEDGDLTDGMLEGVELFIWDSGDYLSQEDIFDENVFIIFDYLDAGGSLFITGSAPNLFATEEIVTLADLEVSGDDPILLDGLEQGQIITLDQSYDTVLSEELELEPGAFSVLVRGPQSSGTGAFVGLANISDFDSQRTVILLLPFVVMPDEIQSILLDNFMAWFGL
jgi:hypothetical protein